MDPITAALILANTIAEMWKAHLASLPPAQQAEAALWVHEDLKAWREFFEKFQLPKDT
jgi:hypothetical protein